MVRIGWLVALVQLVVVDAPVSARQDADAAMSDDVQRMHERLVALSEGGESLSGLRIEFMDGGMAAHRSFLLEAGHLVSKEWASPGSPMLQREGRVSDTRLRMLLQQLIAKRYWTFQGTRFVPDAPVFLFRFYYGDLQYVDFRCEKKEVEASESRIAIRRLFLDFASDTEMTVVR